ncbi:MAG: hypothetical protein HS130_09545 [Deltaproteobacteria bacterium]|nr:hypothetical protein [Deltaproteobacteria bacterium]MCL4872983.1 hypothetical protein [bacterium]
MSEFDKAIDLFSAFEKTEDLKSLREAIEIVEEILDSQDAEFSQKALKLFTVYKDKQISKAKEILKMETNVDQYKKHWNILNEFAAIFSEKELKLVMDELFVKESQVQFDELIRQVVKLRTAGKEEDSTEKIEHFVRDLARRLRKE